MLIDVKVGILLTFLASMKAKVHVCLYQKHAFVFGCFTRESYEAVVTIYVGLPQAHPNNIEYNTNVTIPYYIVD